jgi:hypothetical protein
MDGNFSAEHMRCRSGEQDAPLSAGMAFMANPELYASHLHSGKETIQVFTAPLHFVQCTTHIFIAQYLQHIQGH